MDSSSNVFSSWSSNSVFIFQGTGESDGCPVCVDGLDFLLSHGNSGEAACCPPPAEDPCTACPGGIMVDGTTPVTNEWTCDNLVRDARLIESTDNVCESILDLLVETCCPEGSEVVTKDTLIMSCGSGYMDASNNCADRPRCPQDDAALECMPGQTCFAIPVGNCAGEPTPSPTKAPVFVCGSDSADAKVGCSDGIRCPGGGGAECPAGMGCYPITWLDCGYTTTTEATAPETTMATTATTTTTATTVAPVTTDSPVASPVAVTNAPAPTLPLVWSQTESGCPGAYVYGESYEPAEKVSVAGATHAEVYECTAAPNNQFCGKPGYEPGNSQLILGDRLDGPRLLLGVNLAHGQS
ncbi:hypothetical protein THAOC_01213 [Thalassiosira oceanica]|uniref:Uncharacterized protein n=1 Tax=Thalassiosira oceanica TaxID=159749 RepID=K0TR11_THAOC|nr:hypothetical protein THAOC_01213 [Thalassiosira oceanica]|eukprot:EJK76987.1 hypothetical protein THAOC_01213 [Thalassiosira oceanica]